MGAIFQVSKSCSKGFILALGLCMMLMSGSADAQNAIVSENALAGAPISEWGVPNFRETLINGFATEISVNKGQTVRFKVHSQNASSYTLAIYRIGYYNGNGARKVADLGTLTGVSQPTGIRDSVTGLFDCRNWSESASWAVPANAVSGLYVAKVTRSSGGSNHIVFIVRDDTGNSDIVFQTTDASWQAYNGYGGSYFYAGTTKFPNGRAVKVSYNRPIFPYNSGFLTDNRQSDWYMGTEYPMIRWLERNGYNISYLSSVDVARQGSLLLTHKAFVSAGHDEYWSKEQRDNVEAARNAGVHCAFFTGNEVYWKTRWEADGAGNGFHTLVCYKEGAMADGTVSENACGYKCDPTPNMWTGLWRTGGAYDAGKPENALVGNISWAEANGAIQVPYSYKFNRFWRNTSIANLTSGQTATLAPNSLGYEFDFEQFQDNYPYGRMKLSYTTLNGFPHCLSLYRHNSGALVFGAGTIQWSWGLDANHYGGTGNAVSKDMQQATVNLFADMGIQPGSLQSDLVPATASTDVTAPVTTINTPVNNSIFAPGTAINISGTTADANNIVVVEISFDGGNTWKIANGTTSWSYTWVPASTGSYTIKVRGWDDTGNKGVPGSSANADQVYITIGTATAPPTITTQPVSKTTCEGVSVSFTSAVSETPVPPVQWQLSTDGGSSWANITGATNPTLVVNPVAVDNGKKYRAVWTNAAGSSFSTPATLSVTAAPSAPTGASILSYCFAATVADLTANGTSIKWYAASSGGNSLSNGLYLTDGNHYYATQTVNGCESINRLDVIASVNTSTVPVIYLNGAASVGTVNSYNWTVLSGPNTPVIANPTSANTTVTGLTNGTYTFQLSLNGGANTSKVLVHVNSWDTTLNAQAGFDRRIVLPTSTVKLDGSGSTGSITSYAWSMISGPNQPVFATPNTSIATASGLVQGTYSFELLIKNASNLMQRDTVQIEVASPTVGGSSPNVNATHTASSTNGAAVNNLTALPSGSLLLLSVAQKDPGATIFTASQAQQPTGGSPWNENRSLEMGMKFRATDDGYITGIRFYKPSGDLGTHTGELYTSTGTRLAQAIFANETASGWQQVSLSTPVLIQKGLTYVVAYHCTTGQFQESVNFFQNAVTEGSLTALADGADGPNGLYAYSSTPAFPASTYSKTNYWVDVVYSKADATITSTPSLTWTKRADAAGVVSSGNTEIYTAVLPAGGSVTVNSSWSKGTLSSTLYAITNYDTSMAGLSGNAVGQSLPQVALTTTRPNSLIFGVTADRNAISGSSRAYRESASESLYDYLAANYTAYHYRKLAGTSGTYNMGLSNPVGMAAGTSIFEVLAPYLLPLTADAGYNQSLKLALPPSGLAVQSFCGNATIASLIARGSSIKWYAAASGGTALPSTTVLSNGTHYYASQTINGCESTQRLDVTAVINPLPSPPSITSTLNCNLSTTLSGVASGSYLWSTGDTTASITVSTAGTYSLVVANQFGCKASAAVNVTSNANGYTGLVQSIQHVRCFGQSNGSVVLAASGGVSPYTYSRNNTDFLDSGNFSALVAGSYIFYVKDAAGCTLPVKVVVNQPDSLVLNLSLTNVGVYGAETGVILAKGGGGTPAYAYSLNNTMYQESGSFFNLTAGTYLVSVKDANNCSTSRSAIITQPVDDLTCINNAWTGTVSNAWENPSNWSCGKVPTSNSVVTLNAGTPFSPVISSNVNIKGLNLNGNVLFTINPGYILKIITY